MTLLHTRALGMLSPRPLFQNLDFAIHEQDRIGLVADNGAGKSTLLRCLAGLAEPTAGTITRRRSLRIGFVEQDLPTPLADLTLAESVRRALPPADRADNAWKIDQILDALATPEPMRDRPLNALSGGWQRMALIARAWIADPDLLLLDEPSNHLDLERLAVLEQWIATATPGIAMVIASHDRQFLDTTTNRTLFLRPDTSRLYAHPFTRARHLLSEDDTALQTRNARDAKQADRLRRNAGHLRNVGINSGSDLLLKKAKFLTNRADAIEQSIRPPHQAKTADIRLASSTTHARVLLTLDNLLVTAPDGTNLFRTGKLTIFQRDRIAIMGANGTGKSQFMRLLHRALLQGEPVPNLTASPSISAGYLDQLMSQLPPAQTPFDFITSTHRPGDQRSLSLLAGAGFDLETQRRPIAQLSLGQKSRLGLLSLRLTEPNFYLLDEPTNHVDIAGQERLESEILSQNATCILVSHDRFFTRAIATRMLRIENGRLREED